MACPFGGPAYNGFAKHFFFDGEGVIADNDPVEQEKAIKYNDLVSNAVIFHNVVEQTRITSHTLFAALGNNAAIPYSHA